MFPRGKGVVLGVLGVDKVVSLGTGPEQMVPGVFMFLHRPGGVARFAGFVCMRWIPVHLEDEVEIAVEAYRRQNLSIICREALVSVENKSVFMTPVIRGAEFDTFSPNEQVARREVVIQ